MASHEGGGGGTAHAADSSQGGRNTTRAPVGARGALTCVLAGGLTNLENEVGNCVQIAAALNRPLLLPQTAYELMHARNCRHLWCHLDAEDRAAGGSLSMLGGVVSALASTTSVQLLEATSFGRLLLRVEKLSVLTLDHH